MTHLLTVLTRLTINLEYLPIMLTAVAAVFTGLYWWNARRSFRLELDRVVLWFMLEGGVKKKRYKEQVQEHIREFADRNTPDLSNAKNRDFMKGIAEYSEREEAISQMGADVASLDTLVSKKLRKRLKAIKRKQEESTSDLRNHLNKKDLDNGKTERRENEE